VGIPLPGLVSPAVHTDEDQHDDREDDDHKYPGAAKVMTRPTDYRNTGQHKRLQPGR
jgi:hypothetical protein